jgi:mRNA interferase RelE/StbE
MRCSRSWKAARENNFQKGFSKDLKTHNRDESLLARIQETILEVEAADSITSIKNFEKLKTEGSYYKIRVGSYRIGLIIENEIVTFVRVLQRSQIYRYFP